MHLFKNCATGNVTRKNNLAMFHSLTCLSGLEDEVKDEVALQLSSIQIEFQFYFLKLGQDDLSTVRNPF